jgi:hypothetical protein
MKFGKSLRILLMLMSTASFGEEPDNKYARIEELGDPAKIAINADSNKMEFIAEMVEIEESGPSPFGGRELRSPRPVYMQRTLRLRAGYDPEIIGIASFWDPEEVRFNRDVCDVGVPWVPSITLGGGCVWVLYTRNTYFALILVFKKIATDAPGRPLFKTRTTEVVEPEKLKELSRLAHDQIVPHFKDNWEDEVFTRYKGGFRIRSYENGVVVMGAPVLLVASCVKDQLDSLLDTEFEVARANYEKNQEINSRPIHYKQLMKDREIIIRYHVEKNYWSIEVPDGYRYPRKERLPTENK